METNEQDIKEQIISDVCREYNISKELIESKCRKNELVEPRQVIYFLLRRHTKLSTTQIGKIFNQKHCNVLYANKTIKGYLEHDKIIKEKIQRLDSKIESPFSKYFRNEKNDSIIDEFMKGDWLK